MKKFFEEKINQIKQKPEKDKEKQVIPSKGYGLIIKTLLNNMNNNENKNKTNFYLDSDYINNTYININHNKNPIFLIGIIGFHHKKGSIVEYMYPESNEIILQNQGFFTNLDEKQGKDKNESIINSIKDDLTVYCLPDSVHLWDEDTQFFILSKYKRPLYGISYYKQIKTTSLTSLTSNSIEIDNENTRNCIQKAICIVTEVPIFGNFYNKLKITINVYFNQESLLNKDILIDLYNNYEGLSLKHISMTDFNYCFSLRTLLSLVKSRIFFILKMILLEKKVIIYSSRSINVCSFIFSLLSLIPGLISFGFTNKTKEMIDFSSYLKGFSFPIRVINDEKVKLFPLFSLFDLKDLNDFLSKDIKNGCLIGTTTQIIYSNKGINPDVMINLDNEKDVFEYLHEKVKGIEGCMSKSEKEVYKRISLYSNISNVKPKDHRYDLSWMISEDDDDSHKENDVIRSEIRDYFSNLLCDLSLVIEILKEEITLPLTSSMLSVEKSYFFLLKKILLSHQVEFLSNWVETSNFLFFQTNHLPSISLLSSYVKQAENVTIPYENGSIYTGHVAYGKRNGRGTLIESIANQVFTYNGFFLNDMKNGIGTYTSEGIDYTYVYDGEFYNNKKHGQGQLLIGKMKYSGWFKE